jgi:hypothetical protein
MREDPQKALCVAHGARYAAGEMIDPQMKLF